MYFLKALFFASAVVTKHFRDTQSKNLRPINAYVKAQFYIIKETFYKQWQHCNGELSLAVGK
jgi:hypothetical protein